MARLSSDTPLSPRALSRTGPCRARCGAEPYGVAAPGTSCVLLRDLPNRTRTNRALRALIGERARRPRRKARELGLFEQRPHTMLIAYQVAIDLVRDLRPVVERIRKHDSTLAKQLVDAMRSTVQNFAEAEVHRGRNKRAKFDIAFGEANEVKASLDRTSRSRGAMSAMTTRTHA